MSLQREINERFSRIERTLDTLKTNERGGVSGGAVPAPTAQYEHLEADAAPAWQLVSTLTIPDDDSFHWGPGPGASAKYDSVAAHLEITGAPVHIAQRVGVGAQPDGLLSVVSTQDPLTDLDDPTDYQFGIERRAGVDGAGVGVSFYISSDPNTVGAAIIHIREDSFSKGSLGIYTKRVAAGATDPVLAVTWDSSGNTNVEEDLSFTTGRGITHADGVIAGQYLRADGTRYIPASIAAADLPAHTHAAGAGEGGSLAVGTTDTDATAGSVFFAGVAGVIQEDNANLFWDDGNNELGIGTTTPDGTLHAHTASAGAVTASALADDLVVESGGQGGISILTPDIDVSNIIFGTPTRAQGAWVLWDYTDLKMRITPTTASGTLELGSGNNTVRLTLEASGNILLAPTATLDLNGIADALIMDAAGTLTLSAPTPGQLDIEIAGADDFTFTANSLNVLSGSAVNMADGTALVTGGTLNVEFDSGNNFLEITGGKVGIGTTTIPHGGIGAALLALDGTASSTAAGPHVQYTVSTDDYPVFQQRNWAHDNWAMTADAYYDGSWRSSDAGSNLRILKNADKLTIGYDSGIAQGNVITWNAGLVVDLTNGNVGIGIAAMLDTLHVEGAVLREGWFCGYAAAQSGFTGVSTDIDIDTEVRKDTNYYTHSAGSDNVTITDAGWYRFSYTINMENTDNISNCWRVQVFDDGVAIVHGDSVTSSGDGTGSGANRGRRYAECASSFIAEVGAGSVIDLRTDGFGGSGVFGDNDASYTVLAGSQFTIERIDE